MVSCVGVDVAVVPVPVPAALVAVTVKVYEVFIVRPVKVQLRFEVLVHAAGAATEGLEVTE